MSSDANTTSLGDSVAAKKTEQSYSDDIAELHLQLIDYPDNVSIQKKMKNALSRWSKILQLVFYVASNEGIPYQTKEVGYPCLKMPTERESGHYQCGDVVCYLPEYDRITGVAWDRKGGDKPNPYTYHLNQAGQKIHLDNVNYLAADWYGTVMASHKIKGHDDTVVKEDNIDRFVRECDRSKAEGFDMLIVGVESTLEQFLAYRPNGDVGANNLSRLRRSESIIQKTCGFAHIMYLGSRSNAIDTLVSQNQFWCKNNFVKILGL